MPRRATSALFVACGVAVAVAFTRLGRFDGFADVFWTIVFWLLVVLVLVALVWSVFPTPSR
ncbi:hypothetical protein [Halovenus salina]|uniref:Uncharacterized protein n=1 Tax=Halovenus salina TaxID=1510225 RepID=A0ABD5W140_9EURY|nr:hypothetical protein [Halovenus salina]